MNIRGYPVDETSPQGLLPWRREPHTAASAVRVKVLAQNIGPKGDSHVSKAAMRPRARSVVGKGG